MSLIVQFPWNLRTKSAPPALQKSPASKSAAAKSRAKLKSTNPEGYQQYLEHDRTRKRKSYIPISQRSEEEKKKQQNRWAEAKRNQAKEKKHRDANKLPPGNEAKRFKDLNAEEKKAYMRLKQQESRRNRSKQKATAVKKKDREARATSRRLSKSASPSTPNSAGPSRTTVYRRTTTVKKTMPKSPRTYVSVVANLLNQATPTKRAELEKRGLKRKLEEELVHESVKESIKKLKVNLTEENRKKYHALAYAATCTQRKYGFKHKVAASLGIGNRMRKNLKQSTAARQTRKDAISTTVTEQVQSFWKSEGISHIVPLKKRVKSGQPTYVLDCTYMDAYRQFKVAHPRTKIGYVKFISLKPKFVKHLKAVERIVCCCQKCENLKLKLRALNIKATTSHLANLRIATIRELSDKTLCPYHDGEFPAKSCTDRTCQNCGTHCLLDWYAPLTDQEGETEVTYDAWRLVQEERLVKKAGHSEPIKVTRKHLRLVTSICTVRELVNQVRGSTPGNKVLGGLDQVSSHLFRARWQQDQFRQAKQNMPPKCAVLVTDFAENYSCGIQDEVQAYHWSQAQVTIHPTMAYINASLEVSPEPTHTEAVFIITDDPKHDAAAVETFMKVTNTHLKQKYDLQAVTQFSDCCAAQYRGKTSFADASFTKQDHDLDLTRHYFESSHGKSAADGLGAIVKHNATAAVTRRQVKIRNAEEFHQYCISNLQQVGQSVFQSRTEAYKQASRAFFFVASSDIKRNRPDREVAPVKGTMKVHSVAPTGVPYNIRIRELSCFCTHCRFGQGLCDNEGLVGGWEPVTLMPVVNPAQEGILLLCMSCTNHYFLHVSYPWLCTSHTNHYFCMSHVPALVLFS